MGKRREKYYELEFNDSKLVVVEVRLLREIVIEKTFERNDYFSVGISSIRSLILLKVSLLISGFFNISFVTGMSGLNI